MIEKMKALVTGRNICVLATVSGKKPHCSLMAYVTDDDCREIYMVTHKETTKYRNIMENPNVSILIDTREEHTGPGRSQGKALTIEGECTVIHDEDKKALVRSRLLETHDHMKHFVDHQDAKLLCVRVFSFLLLEGLTDAHFEILEDADR